MASAEDYATWIVANPDKKGTPEFDVVARAYQAARQGAKPEAPQEDTTSFKNVIGAAAEPMMHLASGALAGPVSGLAGLGAIFNNAVGLSDKNPADIVRKTSEAMTYQPRTQGGKTATDFITSPLHAFSDLSNRGGENIAETTGSPLAGALANAGPQAALALLGGKSGPSGEALVPGLNRPFEAIGNAPAAVGTALKNLVTTPSAGKVMNDLAGSRAPDVIQALLANQNKVPGSVANAGEAAVPAGSAEFSALQQAAKQVNPSDYLARDQGNKAARVAEIQSFGKTPEDIARATAEREANAKEAYGSIKDRLINPKSDVQIMEEAIANRAASKGEALRDWGRFATGEAENVTRGDNWTPVPGMPRVPGRVSEFPERASEYASGAQDAKTVAVLRKNEEGYLRNAMESLKETVGLDDKSLFPLLDRPSMKIALADALKGAQETGTYFPAAKGEKFSVANLQRIKQSLDDAVADPASFGIKATEAKEIMGTKKAFVDWLSNKSPEWRDARQQYAADSQPINVMKVGQALEAKLSNPSGQETRASFLNVLDDPTLMLRKQGAPKPASLEDVIGSENFGKAGNVGAELERATRLDELAAAGKGRAAEELRSALPASSLHLPGFWGHTVRVAQAILDRMHGKAGKATMEEISAAMQDPQKTAELMKAATPAERQVIDALLRNQLATGGVVAAGER